MDFILPNGPPKHFFHQFEFVNKFNFGNSKTPGELLFFRLIVQVSDRADHLCWGWGAHLHRGCGQGAPLRQFQGAHLPWSSDQGAHIWRECDPGVPPHCLVFDVISDKANGIIFIIAKTLQRFVIIVKAIGFSVVVFKTIGTVVILVKTFRSVSLPRPLWLYNSVQITESLLSSSGPSREAYMLRSLLSCGRHLCQDSPWCLWSLSSQTLPGFSTNWAGAHHSLLLSYTTVSL